MIPLKPIVVNYGYCMFILRDKYIFNNTWQKPGGVMLKFPKVSRTFVFSHRKQFFQRTQRNVADLRNKLPQIAPHTKWWNTTIEQYVFENTTLKQHDNEM